MVLYMSFDKFLLAVESRDLSQGDKSIIRVSSFPKLNDGYFWMIKFAVIPKKAIWNLAIWQNWCFGQFTNLQLSFFQLFSWEVNLRWLRGFILQKVQASVVERQKKKFFYTSLIFGKEDTLIILLSAWDISRDSTAKRSLSKDM